MESNALSNNGPITDKANYYVYALLDPANNEIFYIGKGKNQRVVDHIKEALNCYQKMTNPSAKVQRILSILQNQQTLPKFIFLRTGLTEQAAYELEGMMIDFLLKYKWFNFLKIADLTNIQNGHHNDVNGIKDMDDLRRILLAEDAVINKTDKILAISINNSYFLANKNVYDAVRSSWSVDVRRANRADYVVAVYQGVIIGVFENVKWTKVANSDRHEFTATQVTDPGILNRLYYHKWTLGFGSGQPLRYNYK